MNIKWIYKGFFFFSVLIPSSPSLCTDQDMREDPVVLQRQHDLKDTSGEKIISSPTRKEKNADPISDIDSTSLKSLPFIPRQKITDTSHPLNSQEKRHKLKESWPIAYYLLKAGTENQYIINNLLNVMTSFSSNKNLLESYYLYDQNSDALKEVWEETKNLGFIPQNLMIYSFYAFYSYIPPYQPKVKPRELAPLIIQSTYQEMKPHLKIHPCCYYVMRAAEFISIKKLDLISEVQSCRQSPRPSIKAKTLASDKPSTLDGQMRLISTYWKLSSILLELIRNLTKSEEKPDFKLYERAHSLLIKDTFTKYLGKSICVTPNSFLPNI